MGEIDAAVGQQFHQKCLGKLSQLIRRLGLREQIIRHLLFGRPKDHLGAHLQQILITSQPCGRHIRGEQRIGTP